MSEQIETVDVLETRIQCKYDTQEKWYSTGFIPDRGELCVFAPDNDHPKARLKIGDGATTIYDLPFVEIGDYTTYEPPTEFIREASVSDASSSLSVRVNEAISSHQIIIAANGDNGFFDSTKCVYGTNVSSWFSNLPQGLSAKIYYNNPDSNKLIIEFNGTPTSICDELMQITIPADYNTDNKDVVVNANNKKFTINRTAQVSDVTISGELGKQITEQTIVVTVGGSPYPFTEEVAVNKSVTTWFSSNNFPHGLSAVVTNIDKTNNKVTIKFSGAPIVLVDNAVMQITIPAKCIVEGKELVVDSNNNAKFNIVEGEHEPAYSASINTKFILRGTQYSVLDESDLLEIIIEGTNPELIDYPATGLDVTHWFKNIPEGLTATIVHEELTATQNLVLVGFSGTPQVACSERMSIIIPKEDFASGGTDVIDTPVSLKNYVVKFEIAEYVEPEPTVVKATLTDVTIARRIKINTDNPLNTNIQINLEGAEWNYDINQSNVSSWITNLSQGLTATVTGIADQLLTIRITGVPQTVKQDIIRITIPGTALSTNEDLVVEENVNAKFDIREPHKLNVPTQSNTLVYTGYALSPTWDNYFAEYLTLGGTIVGIHASTYRATFAIEDKTSCCWNDYSQDDKTVTWTIQKAESDLCVVDLHPVIFDDFTKSVTFYYTSSSDGDLNIYPVGAKVNCVITPFDNKITISVVEGADNFEGSVVITQEEGNNHKASNEITIDITTDFIRSFAATSWEKINELATATDSEGNFINLAKECFDVGDCKTIHIEYDLIDEHIAVDLDVFIVDFTENAIILQGFKDPQTKQVALVDSKYGGLGDKDTNCFAFLTDEELPQDEDQYPGWVTMYHRALYEEGSTNKLFNGLPVELQNVLAEFKSPETSAIDLGMNLRWGDFPEYEAGAGIVVFEQSAKILLPSLPNMFTSVFVDCEHVIGVPGYEEQNRMEFDYTSTDSIPLYDYYKNANSKMFYNYKDKSNSVSIWTRDFAKLTSLVPVHDSPADYEAYITNFGITVTNGEGATTTEPKYSFAICPLFKVGKEQN